MAVVRGANAPLILRTITEQLAQEHKVLDGQAERKEVKSWFLSFYPYLPSGFFHPYQMDESVFNFRGVWCIVSFLY